MIFDCTPYGMEADLKIPDHFIYENHFYLDENNGGDEDAMLIITFIDGEYPKERHIFSIHDSSESIDDIHVYHSYPAFQKPRSHDSFRKLRRKGLV